MSIEDTKIVDVLSMSEDEREVLLTISDHLPWNMEMDRHIQLLRDKINTYLTFIESGELLEAYPKAVGLKPVIRTIGKYPLNAQGHEFYATARKVIERAGFDLRFETLEERKARRLADRS